MRYRCRCLVPTETAWEEVEAPNEEDAANSFHLQRDFGIPYSHEFEPGFRESIRFAKIEVDGYGVFISRTYFRGIVRKGGVQPRAIPTLAEIAKRLDWGGDPSELLEEGWSNEETWEDAESRRKRAL